MKIFIGNWCGTPSLKLTPRELEGVLYCANDLTVKEAARAMRVSPATLKKRLESARFKMGAGSIRALVLEALRLGMISFTAAAHPDPQHESKLDGVFLA